MLGVDAILQNSIEIGLNCAKLGIELVEIVLEFFITITPDQGKSIDSFKGDFDSICCCDFFEEGGIN